MQNYFTKHHFELLKEWKGQEFDKTDPIQTMAYDELKVAYQVTEDWAEKLAARVCPSGYVKLVKRPTNQAGKFAPYNWAKIYPASDSPTQLAYTIGIGEAGIFLVKIDTVGLVESDPARQAYLALRGDMDNSSPFVALLPMEEGLSMSLDGLVDWSENAISKFKLSYDEVVEMTGIMTDGIADGHQEPMIFKNGEHGVILEDPPPKSRGYCMDIWVVGERLMVELDEFPSLDDMRADPRLAKCNPGTLNTQFNRWRNWRGLSSKNDIKRGGGDPPARKPSLQTRPPLNQILFGPPGTGKTYHLQQLLNSHYTKGGSEEPKSTDEPVRRYEFVTFHQSFSYEDFMEGLTPVLDDETGNLRYDVRKGVFLRLCDRARADPTNKYAMIIDEINRANVSKVLGELITLIETDKRAGADNEISLTLPYSGERFSVPSNIDFIGTMNTADRSLTGLDIALRRRFSFVEVPPNPGLLFGVSVEGVDIKLMLEQINERIEVLLDRDHQLGHAYFLPLKSDSSIGKLSFIFRNQIVPLLQEYFFEDWERIRWVLNDHRKGQGHRFVIESGADISALFGQLDDLSSETKRWKLDLEAFHRIESYRGIVDVGAAV